MTNRNIVTEEQLLAAIDKFQDYEEANGESFTLEELVGD